MDGDGIFDFLGDMIGGAINGALNGGGAEAVGSAMEFPGAMRGGSDERSSTATYDRILTGGRRVLNVNDQ